MAVFGRLGRRRSRLDLPASVAGSAPEALPTWCRKSNVVASVLTLAVGGKLSKADNAWTAFVVLEQLVDAEEVMRLSLRVPMRPTAGNASLRSIYFGQERLINVDDWQAPRLGSHWLRPDWESFLLAPERLLQACSPLERCCIRIQRDLIHGFESVMVFIVLSGELGYVRDPVGTQSAGGDNLALFSRKPSIKYGGFGSCVIYGSHTLAS